MTQSEKHYKKQKNKAIKNSFEFKKKHTHSKQTVKKKYARKQNVVV